MSRSKSKIEVYASSPIGFKAKVEVAACYIEINQRLLLLQRYGENGTPGNWSVPAGKLEKNEWPIQAAIRELFEETGISCGVTQMHGQDPLYIRKPDIDYIYHPFKIHLESMPEIHLSREHENYLWIEPSEICKLDLIDGAKEVLAYYQEIDEKTLD